VSSPPLVLLVVERRRLIPLNGCLVGKLSLCYFTLPIEQIGRGVPSRMTRRRKIVNGSKLDSRSSIRVLRTSQKRVVMSENLGLVRIHSIVSRLSVSLLLRLGRVVRYCCGRKKVRTLRGFGVLSSPSSLLSLFSLSPTSRDLDATS